MGLITLTNAKAVLTFCLIIFGVAIENSTAEECTYSGCRVGGSANGLCNTGATGDAGYIVYRGSKSCFLGKKQLCCKPTNVPPPGEECRWSGCIELSRGLCTTPFTGGSGFHIQRGETSCGIYGKRLYCCRALLTSG